jgi:hypothetical protein
MSTIAWDELVQAGAGSLRDGFLRAWERSELAGLQPRRLTLAGDGGRLRTSTTST